MTGNDLATTLIGKLLDWPFLLFILLTVGFFKFRVETSSWLKRVSEVQVESGVGKLHFKIGKDEVPVDKLDTTITARLRDLQEEIESVRSAVNQTIAKASLQSTAGEEGIPPALEDILNKVVYPMPGSNLWLGRFVKTLAEAANVSEETMLSFCKSRSDIGLFKDGGRWVAALSERLKGRSPASETPSAG
jgi:hypothetical protein